MGEKRERRREGVGKRRSRNQLNSVLKCIFQTYTHVHVHVHVYNACAYTCTVTTHRLTGLK